MHKKITLENGLVISIRPYIAKEGEHDNHLIFHVQSESGSHEFELIFKKEAGGKPDHTVFRVKNAQRPQIDAVGGTFVADRPIFTPHFSPDLVVSEMSEKGVVRIVVPLNAMSDLVLNSTKRNF